MLPDVSVARSLHRPHPHLLEIPAWAWLEELSSQQGRSLTLGHVPDAEWDRIRNLGFDLVWMMGVWRRSPAARRLFRTDPSRFAGYDRALPGWKLVDVVGSPYAIQDYHPDPRIGSWRDIDRVRRKLNDRGMGLILDFVPNHTALDHPWIAAHPEFYIEGDEDDFRRHPSDFALVEKPNDGFQFVAHGRDPYFPSWSDTAQLNHFRPETRQALIGVIHELAEHADGLRCDMAMLVLNEIFSRTWKEHLRIDEPAEEFWPAAIAAAPGLIWLAEAYWDLEPRLQQLGFRFVYDKRFYDSIRAGSAPDLRRHLSADFGYQQRTARFLENHDEQRAAAVFGPDRMPAAATLAATAPGLRFYFHGQLNGQKIHHPIELARAAEEPVDAAVHSLYQRLLRLSDADVFHLGRWNLLEVASAGDASSANLVAYQWRSDQNWKLIAANLSGQVSQGRVALGETPNSATRYLLSDQLNDVDYVHSSAELSAGLYVRLDPWRAHLFEIRPCT